MREYQLVYVQAFHAPGKAQVKADAHEGNEQRLALRRRAEEYRGQAEQQERDDAEAVEECVKAQVPGERAGDQAGNGAPGDRGQQCQVQRSQCQSPVTDVAGAFQEHGTDSQNEYHAVQRDGDTHQGPVTREQLEHQRRYRQYGDVHTAQQVEGGRRYDDQTEHGQDAEGVGVLKKLGDELQPVHGAPKARLLDVGGQAAPASAGVDQACPGQAEHQPADKSAQTGGLYVGVAVVTAVSRGADRLDHFLLDL